MEDRVRGNHRGKARLALLSGGLGASLASDHRGCGLEFIVESVGDHLFHLVELGFELADILVVLISQFLWLSRPCLPGSVRTAAPTASAPSTPSPASLLE